MNYYVLTLFPQMIEQGMHTSICKRAIEKNFIHLNTIDIRNFSGNKNGQVDDYPYGGGAGMVMQPAPIYRAYQEVNSYLNGKPKRVIYLTPQGTIFSQQKAKELAKEENLIFLCGHYEGIDERVLELIVTDFISIGDYILTGGELPAMVLMDSIARLVPGVLHNETSAKTESFSENLLEYPQYTRPETWMGKKVPKVLLSGHHANIAKWRKEQSILRTQKNRPDLLKKAELTLQEQQFLSENQTNKL